MSRIEKLILSIIIWTILTCPIWLYDVADDKGSGMGILISAYSSFFVWLIFLAYLGIVLLNRKKHLTKEKKDLLGKLLYPILIIFPICAILFGKVTFGNKVSEFHKKRNIELTEIEKKEHQVYLTRIDSLTLIIKNDENNSNLYLERGLEHRHNGQWKNSVKDYEISINKDSLNLIAYRELAYSLRILEKYDKAISVLEMAYQIKPAKWIRKELLALRKLINKTAPNNG